MTILQRAPDVERQGWALAADGVCQKNVVETSYFDKRKRGSHVAA